ncbi:hypothetical protein JS531_04345 [Bifidobacterium sp. CP2]|uniref:hypothetical protein n=1 Tax=Bifidobacterium TaxID=1678 RepID=UPI001BDD0F3E|nr:MULTISPECIES: hypothetical protein [Bifidobacterium]MBT1181213.1 hypothetical protein [Bifidobacterium sp. CP2]MBW3079896.1 hypothetical protein [Bifidobacterium saguinibicoloris]
MPWWIWLLLTLFMIAMIVLGLVYAFRRAVAALHTVSETGSAIGERFAAMSDIDETEDEAEAPIFTLPLREAAARYERAHTAVIERRQAKRERHVRAWKRWRNAL